MSCSSCQKRGDILRMAMNAAKRNQPVQAVKRVGVVAKSTAADIRRVLNRPKPQGR